LEGALLDHAKWCGVELILFALPGDELARVSGSLGYKIIKVGKKVTVSVVATGKVLKGKAAREALINVAKCGSKTGLTRAGDIGEQIVKWGRGQGAGDVAQTIARTRGLTSDGVREMAKQGLPREWVEKQLSHYRKSFREGGGKLRNEQLLPRKELMERILELWPE
jgi:hypothetical protein